MAFVLVNVGEQFEELIGLRWTRTTFKSAVKLLPFHLLGVELLALESELKRRAKISEYMKVRHAMLKHMSLRPSELKLFLLEQHIKKEQAQQLKQAQRDAKHSAKLSTPPRKRGRPPKQLIPTTPYGDIVPISQTTQGETNER